MSRRKETGVFLENYDKGLGWLASNYLTHYDGESVVGESTTGHMQHPSSARRMGRDVPEARLVFTLRDPVERIYSHYRFHRQSGRLTSDDRFSDLIRDEGGEWRRIHLDNGLYYKHLSRYNRHFDRAQMRIFFFRDLKDDAQALARQLYDFVGVDATFAPKVNREHNAGGMPRYETAYRALQHLWQPIKKRTGIGVLDATQSLRNHVRDWMTKDAANRNAMRPEDRAYLQNFYHDPNRQLENWLDTNLSHWT